MTSNDGDPPIGTQPGARLSRARSFPNAFASLLFSHRTWSSMDSDYVHQPSCSQTLNANNDSDQGVGRDVSLSGLLGAHYEQDSFNWVDPDTNFSVAPSSSSSSTSMRRSETWATSFHRTSDPSQNASRSANDTSAGSSGGSRTVSSVTGSGGGSSLRVLQRSLSEVFGPSKIVIDLPEEVRHETPEVMVNQPSSAPRRMSAPSTSFSGVLGATPLSPTEPGHAHPKSVLPRQSSLAAVLESDPRRDVVLHSPTHPNVEDGRLLKAKFSMPGATSVDENQNAVGHRHLDDTLKMAAGEMTSHDDHVMHVPETAFSRPSRRFGIMDLLGGAGERRKVRNRDVNLVAPQSW